jgi:gliding motility-associated lipoprotein GldH
MHSDKILNFLAAGISLLFIACSGNVVFEENVQIPSNTWKQNAPAEFIAEIKDTVTPCDVYINIRHTGKYAFSNLFLFLNTTVPEGQSYRDTLECALADENGRWYGSGLGDIWDYRVLLKRGVVFGKRGNYQFTLEQGMRIDPLIHVMDIGIRIERQRDIATSEKKTSEKPSDKP